MPFRGGLVRVSSLPLPPAHGVVPAGAAGGACQHGGGGPLQGAALSPLPPPLSSSPEPYGFEMPGLESMDLNEEDVAQPAVRGPPWPGAKG